MTPEGGQYDFCAMTLNQEEVKKKKKKGNQGVTMTELHLWDCVSVF